MIQLIHDSQNEVIDFVVKLIHNKSTVDASEYQPCAAIGILDSGKLIGGVIYNNFRGHDIQMTIATTSPKWANKRVISGLFAYPFLQLQCARVTAVTARRNSKARRMLERLGFKLEGICRRGFDGHQPAIIYGMLNTECKWV